MSVRFTALPLLTALFLSSCGSDAADTSDLKSQLRAAQGDVKAKDFEAALEKFDAVIANAEADETIKYRARRDSVVCAAKVKGDDGFEEALLALTDEHGDQLDAHALAKISNDLAGVELYALAGQVIVAADEYISRLSSKEEQAKLSASFATLSKRIVESGQGGDELAASLASLGYLGSD